MSRYIVYASKDNKIGSKSTLVEALKLAYAYGYDFPLDSWLFTYSDLETFENFLKALEYNSIRITKNNVVIWKEEFSNIKELYKKYKDVIMS